MVFLLYQKGRDSPSFRTQECRRVRHRPAFSADELKALDVESSKVIDLETFVPRAEIDPVYFDTPYYLYPDGPMAIETLRVISAAMAEAGIAGIGRLTLSRRERMVMVEPRDTGMALFTLRAAGEVRAPQFGSAEGDLDAEMVAIAGTIIRQRTGNSPLAPTAMVPAMVVVSTPMGTSKIWISMCKAFASGLARTGRIPCALAISLP